MHRLERLLYTPLTPGALVFALALAGATPAWSVTPRPLLSPAGAAAGDLFGYSVASAGDDLGWSVASAGDVNGDGFADVIVGAWGNDAGGPSSAIRWREPGT